MKNLNNTKEEKLNINDINDCALSIRKNLVHLKQEMKDYKHNKEYLTYLEKAYTKMTSAMLYAQEIREKLKGRQSQDY